jgi:hypothetical protein
MLAARAAALNKQLRGEVDMVRAFVEPDAGRWAAAATGVVLLAAAGHWLWRRRRRAEEAGAESVQWAQAAAQARPARPPAGMDEVLPDGLVPDEAARVVYGAGASISAAEVSRREATLTDLHHLHGQLQRRSDRGDTIAAMLVLQQHVVDFRYTSPWVFLELRELYRLLDRPRDWDLAREAFRERFGQNAPAWDAPSQLDAELAQDRQLAPELARLWPSREARIFILRWMLGDPEVQRKASGPPQLPLGVYRDLMELDTLLDELLAARLAPAGDAA